MSGRGPRGPPERTRPYKVLCVSSLHSKASDDVIRDTLYREYKKYGDISVRVVLDPDGRVAYVYFRNFEDARDARHSKSRIILFDKPAIVEPVYESRSEPASSSSSSYMRRRSMTPPPMQSYPRYRSRSRSPPPPSSSYYRDGYRGGGDHYPHPSRGDYDRGPRRDHHHHHHHNSHHHGGHHHYERHDHYEPRGRGRGRGRSNYHDSGRRGGGGGREPAFDHKNKDKFPNYLDHIPPEDDPLATRTLFTGNLELNITDDEMRRIFGRYGNLLDIDIKRPPPGTGNAYAFIRYENLDMAHRAKTELSGQYIGKFQCKIGYGKVNATTKVWVGGLGTWCNRDLLWKEFDRFGAIKDIEYRSGDTYAHIYYENIDAAQAAVQEMRGHPLGGPDKRLRIDFADLDVVVPASTNKRSHVDYEAADRRGGGGGGRYRGRGGHDDWRRGHDEPRGPPRRSPESGEDFSPRSSAPDLANVATVSGLMNKTPKVWDGGLILKNSLFPTKLHIVEGNRHVASSLRDEAGKPNLKITQRLRLDQGKLDDVTKRVNASSSHAVFLAAPTSVAMTHDNPDVQSRPLRNLISYLKQKEAAGVISMAGGDDSAHGVLYCFPPCPYSMDLLRREAPELADEGKEDFLVVVVVCGSAQS